MKKFKNINSYSKKTYNQKNKKLKLNPKYKIKNKNKRIRKKILKRNLTRLTLRLFFIAIIYICFYNFQEDSSNKSFSDTENTRKTTKIESLNSHSNKMNFTVCIDPGHGGYDHGSISVNDISEKDVTLKIALKVGEILEKKNVNVIYTRTSDKVSWPSDNKLDLRKRVEISNNAKADMFISIHLNSSSDYTYRGIESWCRFPNTDGENLSKHIQTELVNIGYSVDRGIKYESQKSLAVLKLNNSVSSLIELGFLNNSSDIIFLSSEKGQELCAEAIANGILNYKSS